MNKIAGFSGCGHSRAIEALGLGIIKTIKKWAWIPIDGVMQIRDRSQA